MTTVIIIVVIVLVLIAVAFAINLLRAGSAGVAEVMAPDGAFRLHPPVDEFHVRGDTATVQFGVPVPEEIDDALSDLLTHEAVEVVREKKATLPIDQVTKVVAYGIHHGEPKEVGSVTLDTPGELPPPLVLAENAPHASKLSVDVLGEFAETLPSTTPVAAETQREGDLASVSDEFRLTAAAQAGLRAQGIDPNEMSVAELVTGLFRITGYQVMEGGTPDTYLASKGGVRTFVQVIPHEAGSYPEIGEDVIRKFVVDFGSSGADRGLLISDKFAPFEIYERERRDKRIRFVTRERLQGFVDALSVS